MPNNFTVVGLCVRDVSVDDDLEIELSPLEEIDLCEAVLPMPEVFKYISAETRACRYIHKETGEMEEDCGPLEMNIEDCNRVELSETELEELQQEHGATTWVEWCEKHWGTKWGTYELSVTELPGDAFPILISFVTAWGPPNPKVMGMIECYLKDQFSLFKFKWMGVNPYDDSTLTIDVEPTQ